jgi:hypothetical protein
MITPAIGTLIMRQYRESSLVRRARKVGLLLALLCLERTCQARIFTKLTSPSDRSAAAGCGWIDFDHDGRLDAYLTHFNDGCRLFTTDGQGGFKLANRPDLTPVATNYSGFSWGDYDNDGNPDLYVTSMSGTNILLRDSGKGFFQQVTASGATADGGSFLYSTWVDYDNDGFLDLFVGCGYSNQGSAAQKNILFHNNGDKTFTRVTEGPVASHTGCTWASAWGDVDNDGDLDLYVGTIYEKHELLYLNNGDGTFTEAPELDLNTGATGTGITGASLGDYDNDGFLDLLVADASGSGPILFHNNGNANHWISVTCVGTASNRSAIGARVKIKATLFGKSYWQIRDVTGNQGFRGCNDLRAHFGLGDASSIESLVIHWPSGVETVLTNVAANQVLTVTEGRDPNGPVYNLTTGDRFVGVQAAVACAAAGEVILVSPGTYAEHILLPNVALTVRGTNPLDSAVTSRTTVCGGKGPTTVTCAPGTALRCLEGLTFTGGVDCVTCPGGDLKLSHCVITGATDCGVKASAEATLSMDHCIVAGNSRVGLCSRPRATSRSGARYSKIDLAFCTFAQNGQYALEGNGMTVTNSILYASGPSGIATPIKGSNVTATYSDVQAGFGGQGNLDIDPAFVALGTWTDTNTYVMGDFHLKSKVGHWDPLSRTWVPDDATSPCIDAGDPKSPLEGETLGPCGSVVDMGSYGATVEASRRE